MSIFDDMNIIVDEFYDKTNNIVKQDEETFLKELLDLTYKDGLNSKTKIRIKIIKRLNKLKEETK